MIPEGMRVGQVHNHIDLAAGNHKQVRWLAAVIYVVVKKPSLNEELCQGKRMPGLLVLTFHQAHLSPTVF